MKYLYHHRSLLLRVGLSALLIGVILSQIELGRVIGILAAAQLEFVVLAFCVVTLERILLAYKWRVLLAVKGLSISLLRLVKICYVTNFLGTFMPSSFGVDALRAYSLYRHGTELSESVSSVLADKVLSICVALAIPVTTVLLFPQVLPGDAVRWTVLATAAVLAIGLLCLLSRPMAGLGLALAEKVSRRIAAKASMLHDSVREYLGYADTVLYVLLLSFVFQLLRVTGVYLLGVSMALEISFLHCLAFVPIIITLMMIPVSVAGFGVREGGFVYFFAQVGIPVSDAFALSVLVYVVGIAAILPGGLIYASDGIASRNPRQGRSESTLGKL